MPDCCGVVHVPGLWVRDPDEVAAEGAGELDVDAGAVVLAGVQFGVVLPGPAGEQAAVDDELAVRIEAVSGRDPAGEQGTENRHEFSDRSRDGGLGDSVVLSDFILDVVSPQVRQGDGDSSKETERFLATSGRANPRILPTDESTQVGYFA